MRSHDSRLLGTPMPVLGWMSPHPCKVLEAMMLPTYTVHQILASLGSGFLSTCFMEAVPGAQKGQVTIRRPQRGQLAEQESHLFIH